MDIFKKIIAVLLITGCICLVYYLGLNSQKHKKINCRCECDQEVEFKSHNSEGTKQNGRTY